MKKMWKRFVSLLLACTLLAGMLPLSASAAVSAPGEGSDQYKYAKGILDKLNESIEGSESEYDLIGPASLGDSELYTYLLTRYYILEGTTEVIVDNQYVIVPGVDMTDGNMPDYDSSEDGQPWVSANASAVYIADGVTGIGSHAFNGMDTLEKVVFQDASDLTYVGSYAFNGDSRAQFTDEGNSNAGGDDPTRILDLSHVEKMGENAFYNCDGIKGVELSGNIIAVETKEEGGTEEINHKIPNYAFGSCNALTSITVPEGIETIGTAAFAGCTQASSITLPDSLVTIGDRAFACSIDGDNKQLTALTIPENVVTIGASAFYGYTALTTVTVESTKLDKPGDAAFGNDDMSAYSGQQTVGDVTVENGGTTFKTPNAEITKLFVNHDNCYLGPISPLTLIEEKSWPATCQHVGRNTYAYKYYEEEQELFEEIEMLPHVYITPSDPTWPEGFPEEKYPVDFPETCDTAPYRLSYCFNCLTEAYPAGDITAVTEPHTTTEYGNREEEPGHDYNCAGIGNETIQEGKNTTISYSCDHAYHDDVRDGIAQEYGVTFKGFTLTANTVSYQDGKAVQNTLKSIAMPRNVYTESGTLVGAINWASSVNLEEKLSEDTKQYPVVFTPSDALKGTYDGMEDVDSYEDKILQVTVTVSKTVLSLENLRFENVLNFMDVNSSKGIEATVAYQSQDLTSAVLGTEPKSKSYTGKYADGQNESTTDTAPVNSGAWDGTVTMTFTYNSDLYQVDTETANEEYTVVDSKDGTLQVTHTYKISKEDLSGASVIAISRTYLETEESEALNAFRLINTPAESTVNWTWRNVSDFSETDNGAFITEDTSTNFAPIKEAGTYEIEVTISNPNCEPQTLTLKYDKNQQVTISPARVQIPSVNELTEYTGEEQTALNKPADTAGWQYTEESVLADTEAGTYTATAKLKDTRNYAWYDGNDPAQNAENGEYTITWSIAKRDIFEPLYQGSSGTYTLPYNRQVQKNALVDKPTKVSNLFKVEENNKPDGTTSWIGTFIATNTQVFEITNIGAQNASKYTIQAVISEEAFQNFQWENHKTNASFDLANWEITKYQVELNQVTAPEAVYTAKAYTGEPSVALPTGLPDNGLEVRSYTYYTYSGGKYNEIEKDAVIDAGTYYVRANYAFQGDTENSILKNYNLVQPRQYASFTITPCILTLNGTTRTEQYTGGKFTVTDPTVTLLEGDQGEAGLYTYTYTTYPEDDEQHQNPITHTQSPEYEDVGTYLVYVGIDSKNYSADPVECKLEIRSSNQTVKLTQEGGTEVADGGSISKTLGNDPFTVTGKGYVGENATNAEITYAVTQSNASDQSGEAVVKVDANSGQVTLLRAGSATITVTAAGSANYQKATATYTITVGKGTPTVEVQMPEGDVDNTYSYTGEALTFSATVTGAGNGAVNPTTDKKVTYKFYNNGEGDQLEGEALAKQPTGIGTYWVEAVYEGDDNYNGATSDAEKFTISPAALKVEATGYDAIYDGRKHDPVKSIKVTGVDEKLFTKDDYTISYAKKTDGQTDAPAADSGAWKTDTQVKDVADSGDYWIKVVIKDDDSYNAYIDSVNVDIDPKPLTVTKTVTLRKTYDGTTKATVDFDTITTGITGELVTADLVSAVYNSPNVEQADTITITYKLTADPETDTDLANYSLDGKAVTGAEMDETVTEGVGITPASITVDIEDQKKVYDGSVATPSQSEWSVDEEKLYDVDGDGTKDNLGITLSIDSGSKNAGTYAIIGEAGNDNYDVIFTGSWKGEEHKSEAGTYTITPRPIDVKIGNAEGFYGDAPVLKGVELTYEQTGDNRGLASGETSVSGIQLGTGANKESPVAEYTIYAVNGDNQVGLNTPEVIGNYNVTFTNEGTYTVKQRPITITISDAESDYGCDLAQLTYSKTLSEAYTDTNKGVVFVGDDETDLGITLSTTANKSSDAGAYSISGKVTNKDLAKNYAITWKGQTPYQENEEQATYTVKKATLAVEFTNEEVTVSMGGTVNNPLKFINQSNSDEELGGQPQDVTVKYSSNDQGVATVNETTGEITLVGTGNATITAEVTSGGKNFTEGAKDSYIIHVAEDGGLLVTVTPKTLTYTGEMQNLISYSTAPAGAEVTFKVEAQTEGDRCQIASDDGLPQGQDAGTYRVSWVAKLQGYRDATGSTTVTIAKASPTTGFSKETVSVPYEENGTFDSTEETTLNVADDYNGTITYMSNDTRVASVQGNSLENISLNGTGSATITAVFTETDNYTAATASFRITVGTAETTISYTAEDYSVEYDRTAHGSKITVNSPSEYTIMYSDNNGTSYDLNESPTITDAGDLTIYFQIQADGYNSASGTQKVTVEPKEITANMIAGIAGSYTYTGKEITFDDAISLHDEGVLLKQDTDYTIDYGDNKEVGTGSVTITGMGNYTGSMMKNFEITPVDASDLTASLNRTFGYYGDSNTNNGTVTVTHGRHEVNEQSGDTVSVTVTQFNGATANGEATVSGQTVTFNQVGTYTIEVEVTGNHATNAPIKLTYALLPVEEGELVLKADNETSIVATYGDTVDGAITVTDASDTPMTESTDYTLTYTYTPFEGTAQGSKPYDPSVMSGTPAAGMYVVTATGRGGYANSVGTFTFLILQRDLADATLGVDDEGLTFNHDEKKPDVTVTVDGNAQPTEDADYTVTYYNNVNASDEAKAVVTATGNNFTGSNTENFSIAPKEITDEMVKEIPEQYYTGNAVIPPVTITDGNYTLILGYDYTTACTNKGPGAAKVTITGTGNYTGTTTKDFVIKSEGAPEPSERFDLAVRPSQWTWGDDLKDLALNVTFGTGNELTLGREYTLSINNEVYGDAAGETKEQAIEAIKSLKPGKYTITATGVGAYNGSTDTETVAIQKIQPKVTVTATPNSLSGGGKVTLTLKGEKLPAFAEGEDLSDLLTVKVQNGQQAPNLTELEWTENQDGSLTAELTLPNTNETYTFTLSFVGNDYYESASSNAMVVVGQQTSGGGGGSDPGDQPADPDDTGVSDWLNTKDHLAYLAGYPGGTFGPDQNMTRAEAAQMFYNLLLEKDVEITVEFVDVPEDAWYATPVNTLASLGILSGVGNGRFDPERSITRAEFTVIAMKFANTSGGGVNIFSDVNEDDWFYSAVVDSTQYGWINGYPDGTFRPEATISRAEVTVIVNHMLGRAADRPYVIAHEKELNTFGDVNRGHWGYFHIAEATNAHEYHTEDGTESWTGLS